MNGWDLAVFTLSGNFKGTNCIHFFLYESCL